MVQVIQWVIVLIGFRFGASIGGNLGSVLGGVLAFAGCLLGMDIILANRSINGFLRRHRGSFLEFAAVVIGVILGRHFSTSFIAELAGVVAGVYCGQWLAHRLSWGGDAYQYELVRRLIYLGVLDFVATTGSPVSERGRHELLAVARRLFGDLGYSSDHDIAAFLVYAQQCFASNDIPTFIATLPREWQWSLVWDALQISYATVPVAHEKRQFIQSICDWGGLVDQSLIADYDRATTPTSIGRQEWLKELGLKSEATSEEIEVAYRRAAKQYHPDRLHDIPSHLSDLAQQKLTALNAAYRGLKNVRRTRDAFRFRGADEQEIVLENLVQSFTCRCWLCDRSNRLPARADLDLARCGQCHAFLGRVIPQ